MRTRLLPQVAESLGLAAISGLVGWFVGLPFGIPLLTSTAAGLNGTISGSLQTYSFTSTKGWWAWIRDVTWALPNTALAVTVFLLQLLRRDSRYLPELSRRHNRIVFAGGWRLKPGYVTTIGHVVVNAYDRKELDQPTRASRNRLVEIHEELHITQGRRYGIIFLLIYVVWATIGLFRAAAWKLSGAPERWGEVLMTAAYFSNPFERAAYRADSNWPPRGSISRKLRL